MQMLSYFKKNILLFAAILFLIHGCGNKNETPCFPVELDFSTYGFPLCVAAFEGIAGFDSNGRRTVGEIASIKFDTALPEKFTLSVTAFSFGPNSKEPVTVKAGNMEKRITLQPWKHSSHTLVFETEIPADTIEFIIPVSGLPQDLPQNQYGIRIKSIKIEEVRDSPEKKPNE